MKNSVEPNTGWLGTHTADVCLTGFSLIYTKKKRRCGGEGSELPYNLLNTNLAIMSCKSIFSETKMTSVCAPHLFGKTNMT